MSQQYLRETDGFLSGQLAFIKHLERTLKRALKQKCIPRIDF